MAGNGQHPRTIVVVVDDPATTDGDGPRLCGRIRDLLAASDTDVGILDVGALTDPDIATVDALARVLLTARRMGRDVRLRHASPALRELLDLAGLGGAWRGAPPRDVEHRSHPTDGGRPP